MDYKFIFLLCFVTSLQFPDGNSQTTLSPSKSFAFESTTASLETSTATTINMATLLPTGSTMMSTPVITTVPSSMAFMDATTTSSNEVLEGSSGKIKFCLFFIIHRILLRCWL
ncbi:uncharacterized protein LOC144744060 [Ciona intestinalis]